MDDKELFDEIMWVMTHYGSDAGDRAEPGSKLRSQAERIVAFVVQRDEARALLAQHGFDHVRVVSRATHV
jgi:hypothetical protein